VFMYFHGTHGLSVKHQLKPSWLPYAKESFLINRYYTKRPYMVREAN